MSAITENLGVQANHLPAPSAAPPLTHLGRYRVGGFLLHCGLRTTDSHPPSDRVNVHPGGCDEEAVARKHCFYCADRRVRDGG
jgi:hypothetical protein